MPREDRLILTIDGVEDDIRVAEVDGIEGISELYRVEITFVTENADLDPASMIGKKAVLQIACEGETRFMAGIIGRFEDGEAGKRLVAYHLSLVPKLETLTHRYDIRIFQEMTAVQIIEKVLQGAGLVSGTDYRLSVQGSYRLREYCVQYRESDYAFVCRLMEDEGISYYFEHSESGHVLVIADGNDVYSPIPGDSTVLFRPPLGAMALHEHISRFRFGSSVRSGKFTYRDHNLDKPKLDLTGDSPAPAETDLAVYDFPGGYVTKEEGQGLATVRLQERRAAKLEGVGESSCPRLVSGHTFTLSEHSRDALNQTYLITHLEFHAMEPVMGETGHDESEERYSCRFTCIPSSVRYRPPMTTPRPFVRGVQTAVVVGPPGEEIYVDEQGRVKVQFHWDRLGTLDDKSSCWVRVSQLWAGEGWGAMHIPRIGHEVIVDFLEGDPDRPILVGRIYHGMNPVPYPLPANKTRSTIKSNSTPGGGGYNELRFEDKKGEEEVFVHAQKDLLSIVENDETRFVHHDQTETIDHDRTLLVKNDEKLTVNGNRTREVDKDETITIKGNQTIEVEKDQTETILGNDSLTINKTSTTHVVEDTTVNLDAKLTAKVTGKTSIEFQADVDEKLMANHSEHVMLKKVVTVDDKIEIVCGQAKIEIDKMGNIKVEGLKLKVVAQESAEIESATVTVKALAEATVEATGKVQIKSSGLTSVTASGPVTVKGAMIGLN